MSSYCRFAPPHFYLYTHEGLASEPEKLLGLQASSLSPFMYFIHNSCSGSLPKFQCKQEKLTQLKKLCATHKTTRSLPMCEGLLVDTCQSCQHWYPLLIKFLERRKMVKYLNQNICVHIPDARCKHGRNCVSVSIRGGHLEGGITIGNLPSKWFGLTKYIWKLGLPNK